MFLPFTKLSTRQSAGYAVLCVVLGLGIKYLDDHEPQRDPTKLKSDGLAWSDFDEQADARRKAKKSAVRNS